MPGFIDTVPAKVGDVTDRSSLLFVGRLMEDNTPNVDSMDWFMQKVFPLLPENLKEIHVVGQIRDDFRQHYERLGATVHGQVDDVTDFYRRARVFVAPTRFAAGIPIKVIETASHGLPFVTTPLLAQQLGWQTESFCRTATTPSQFARAIVELGEDDKLWHTTRTEMLASVRRDYGDESFHEAIDRVTGPRAMLPE
jgi:glycosyltransferase involved in cell wall biosynthesis